MSGHLHDLGIAALRTGIASGAFSAREVTEAALDRVAAFDGAVHAFLEVTQSAALATADAVDAARAAGRFAQLGPLAGVPVAFKDNMNLVGTHTTCASRMLENYVSPYTATCVARTLAAGAVSLGKCNMDEFAFGSSTETSAFGRTCNPWDLTRVPGGSSGGSAAAVAAGMVCASLGSDTGGSIRQPASFCGVVGIKPTYGVVSRYGVVAFGSSLDQVGPFARSVEDAAFVLTAIAGRDPLDCTSQPVDACFVEAARQGAGGVAGMRVGIVPEFMEAKGLAPEVAAKVLAAVEALRDAGADIVEVELPNVHAAISAYYVLAPCEAFSNLARFDSVRYGYCAPACADLGQQYEASRRTGFGPEARRRIMLGGYLLGAGVYDKYYYPAQQIRTLITEDYARAFQQVDVILTPVAPRNAFRFGEVSDPTEMYLSDMFTISINIAGNGGMSVPVGLGAESGLPTGVQLICPAFRDQNMIRAAAALETAFGPLGVAPNFAKSPDESEKSGRLVRGCASDSSERDHQATGPATAAEAPSPASPEGGAR